MESFHYTDVFSLLSAGIELVEFRYDMGCVGHGAKCDVKYSVEHDVVFGVGQDVGHGSEYGVRHGVGHGEGYGVWRHISLVSVRDSLRVFNFWQRVLCARAIPFKCLSRAERECTIISHASEERP